VVAITADSNIYISGLIFGGSPDEILNLARAGEIKVNRILEHALAGGSDYVITGDRHLLKLGGFEGVKTVKPVEFLIHFANV
jgi:predicted nucleic acid-binding protein